LDLPSPLLVQPSSSITTLAIRDDDFDGGDSEAFSVCSSPLSDSVDTVMLEASSRATDGNIILEMLAECERVFSSLRRILFRRVSA
jgi:hypothetical protein